MKKLLIILFAVLLPILAHAQEKRLILKDGTVLVGEVELQADGTYRFKSSEGDVFFFQPSEVQRVVDLETRGITTVNGIAVYRDVYRKKGELRFSGSNQALTEFDFTNQESWQNYQVAHNKWKAGTVLLISGVPSFVIGETFLVLGSIFGPEPLTIASGGLAVLGLAASTTGLVLTLSANSSLKKMANAYNEHPGYVIDFGVQQHGIGLAINF